MKNFLRLSTVLVLLSSCAATMLTDKTVKPADITDLANFETVSMIHFIEKGNRMQPHDSLSLVSTRTLDSIALAGQNPRIVRSLTVADTATRKQFRMDVLATIEQIMKTHKIDQVRTTPLMDSIARGQNQRYTLCLVNAGFTRKKGNYTNQVAKGIGIGILTLGLVTPVPVKATTSMYALIYDAQRSTVVFYNSLPPVEKSPVDPKNLTGLYNQLYKGYFTRVQ